MFVIIHNLSTKAPQQVFADAKNAKNEALISTSCTRKTKPCPRTISLFGSYYAHCFTNPPTLPSTKSLTEANHNELTTSQTCTKTPPIVCNKQQTDKRTK